MARDTIEVIGAKQNNLKNVDVEIPRDKLTVITGVSGSGKSSLAFDVVYGEAQRRFLNSLSNFTKNFINQVKKPKVDFVRGLSPVIAIEQKKGNANPRSTVGTVTDIQDYLRLLFATAGTGKCPECDCALKPVSAGKIAEHIASLPTGTVVELRAPIEKVHGQSYNFLFDSIRKRGYSKVMLDGRIVELSEKGEIDEETDYKMEVIIDRFTVSNGMYIQIAKTIDAAMISLQEDIFLRCEIVEGDCPSDFYDRIACPAHHYTLYELQAFHFSPNISASACGTCSGIGMSHVVEPRFLVIAPEKSILRGALKSMVFNIASKDSYRAAIIYSVAEHFGFSLNTPFNELSQEARDIIFYGSKGENIKMVQPPFAKRRNWVVGREFAYRGIVRDIESWYWGYIHRTTGTEAIEPGFVKEVMIENTCPDCNGARLKRSRLEVTIAGKNIDDLSRMQFPDLVSFLNSVDYDETVRDVAKSITIEVTARIQLLIDIGLYYLNLGRRSDTISGGEMQRIKMSTQISSELMGMLYVMDEPSIGLHARDTGKVIDIMKRLCSIGNTVIVVEHDLETMRNADYLIEVGPGAGIHGGNILSTGTKEQLMKRKDSVTGAYMSGKRKIAVPKKRRTPKEECITIQGACENNLKNLDIEIPLGVFLCVTGVSGSGKSTLIKDTLFKQMEIVKKGARIVPGKHDHMFGHETINNVINIDQSAIGRSSKSNPATYVGIFDRIRSIFASEPDAVARGYKPIDFSLTHANGTRCEHCTGDGIITTNLQFMADIETVCPVCKGMRFSQEGLEVTVKGKNIGQVLEMTVEEALKFFEDVPYLKHKLGIMYELGLGYLTLGQSSTTLSGGEAQRIKLSYELAKIKRGSHNLYILDEPTTGLHISDIERLLLSINKLVDKGHSVIIIEHNMDVIKCCDYIIDMGPEGGQGGGYVVAQGTPEQIAGIEASHTGRFLKQELA